ncbi:methyltransferase domain-containing protein [Yinghuangia sp. ASG 101]|uniref:class I SAM-dependent methyltransferase n=1 Tax=Yinghuangia sp. ASG 101 TaxID=2896848 RepID=UPI001E381EBE|nr:methyltransferase domain-containing protein [Yinghuangia sp. ASG 101]UGQ09043.1 methyltransferase domain-containing protein [Yinghuangia sp. ASG 101]
MTSEPGLRLSGDTAERYASHVAVIMAPFVAALLDAARPRPGDAVLDVACGTGFTALAAADLVGADGSVIGVDVDPGALDDAAARTPDTAPVFWHRASADALPFDDAAFDAVLCAQGVQFFPDRDAAFTEFARVLRPGGRVAATTWSSIDGSPYFLAQQLAIDEVAGPDAAASYGTAFACTAKHLAAAMRATGFDEVRTRELRVTIALPRLVDFAPAHLSALPWAAVAEAHPDGIRRVTDTLCELLRPFTASDGTAVLPFTSTVASAVR